MDFSAVYFFRQFVGEAKSHHSTTVTDVEFYVHEKLLQVLRLRSKTENAFQDQLWNENLEEKDVLKVIYTVLKYISYDN